MCFGCTACTTYGTFNLMMTPKKKITAVFYRLSSGKEPVRDWLLSLTQEDRQTIGQDIMAVEFGWPCGEPLCKSLSSYPGLWEVRSNIRSGIARVFFYIDKSEMILLHGMVKKTQKTPDRDLKLAQKRKTEYERNG
jgi:phage-related protein